MQNAAAAKKENSVIYDMGIVVTLQSILGRVSRVKEN